MKYQKYDKYKDSGIKWLAEIPSHWQNLKIKYLAIGNGSLFIDGDWIESKEIIYDQDKIRYITTGNIGEGKFKEQGFGYINEETFEALNCTEVFPEDILISRLNPPIGRACLVPNLKNRIVTSVDNVILRPKPNQDKKFLVYYFSNPKYFEYTNLVGRGATMQRISRSMLGSIEIALPPYKEQQNIANFLDHETTRIDTLIEKKRKLIELLREKRTALITKAVTKGLNPDVKMKDSGIEWLGEVPEHWENWKLSYGYGLIGSGTTPKSDSYNYYDDGKIPWVTTSELRETVIYDTKNKLTQSAITDYSSLKKYPAGSLLFALYGATIGRLGILGVDATVNQACCVFAKPKVFYNYFVFYWFFMARPILISMSYGGGQPNLSKDMLGKIVIPTPSIEEQKEIADYLNYELNQIDALISKIEQAITKHQEFRTTLISAAVTGKIKVPEE